MTLEKALSNLKGSDACRWHLQVKVYPKVPFGGRSVSIISANLERLLQEPIYPDDSDIVRWLRFTDEGSGQEIVVDSIGLTVGQLMDALHGLQTKTI